MAPAPAVTMSPADMQAGAARFDTQMKDDLREVLHFQEIARKQKDVIKLNCVNDRLVQIKAQMNVAESTNQQLQVSLAKNADESHQLYTELSGSAETIHNLRGQADSCIGTPDLYKQESGVTVEHPDLPDDPTIETPFQPDIEPPGYASPFN